MINIKKIVNDLLDNTSLEGINIYCGYPNEIEQFPAVVFFEDGQREIERADNKAKWNECEVEINIFTKKLDGYKTSNEIAFKLNEIFYNDDWSCLNNKEIGDPDNEVEHRVLNYRKEFLF